MNISWYEALAFATVWIMAFILPSVNVIENRWVSGSFYFIIFFTSVSLFAYLITKSHKIYFKQKLTEVKK